VNSSQGLVLIHAFAFGQTTPLIRSSRLEVTAQRNSKLSPEAMLYWSAGWQQCPNTGTPGSQGFAPSDWLEPAHCQPKRTPIFQPKHLLQWSSPSQVSRRSFPVTRT